MIKALRKKITEEKIAKVKKLVSSGSSLREAAKHAGISYYSAWHIAKGSYDNDKRLADAFREPDNGFFNWDNFKAY